MFLEILFFLVSWNLKITDFFKHKKLTIFCVTVPWIPCLLIEKVRLDENENWWVS